MVKYNTFFICLIAIIVGGFPLLSQASSYLWSSPTISGSHPWDAIAYSADGTKLFAADDGYVYVSSNSGATWATSTGTGQEYWQTLAVSQNGTKVVAAGDQSDIFFSTNSGSTWATSSSAGVHSWISLTSSSDGTKVAVIDFDDDQILISTDSGATWATSTSASSHSWGALAYSADGTKLYAASGDGYTYVSTNGGSTWTSSANPNGTNWFAIASSADGSRLLAGSPYGQNQHLFLFTSPNGGAAWATSTGAGSHSWHNVASSADGTKLIAAAALNSGYIYTSVDSGVTWATSTVAGQHNWQSVTISADGTKVGAVAYDGTLFLARTRFSPPSLFNLNSTVASSTYTLSYETDELATSTLAVNPQGIMQYASSTVASSTSYNFTLNNLVPCAQYQYNLDLNDAYDNATSTSEPFNTTCLANAVVATSTILNIATSTGGTLSLNTLTLSVPAGYSTTSSQSSFQAFELDAPTVLSAFPVPSNQLVNAGNIYQLSSITGTSTSLSTFSTPLTVTMTYDPSALGSTDQNSLVIYRNDGGSWQALTSCTVDTSNHTVSCPTSNFSTFAIFGATPNSGNAAPIIISGGYSFGSSFALDTSVSTLPPQTITSTSTVPFTLNLALGSVGAEVKALQIFLNTHGYIVATSGFGSPHNETDYFGPLTRKALIKFQKDYKITPAIGFFGNITRGIINKIL
ncbi:MAG: peptidoglycan-binding protein [Candidatus Pacebacteria bacterium]|nr:peptidoglycan-binding protein [Candidatus Paceibacterota bacterium]